jgi:peptidoglycan/xylan/chitin deacetylase (PgdA/CDA1 family)
MAAALAARILTVFCRAGASDAPLGATVTLPGVMYHEINLTKLGKDVISPRDFENDLLYLRDQGYTAITVRELLDYYDGIAGLPPKPIILSFDDGYLSNYIYVLPLLEKYDAKIVLSIIVRDTEDFTVAPNYKLNYAQVTWPQVNEMIASGRIEVQNHTYDLHRITNSLYGSAQKENESFSDYEQRLSEDLCGPRTISSG